MQLWLILVKIAGYAATPLLTISYLPQIITLYKTKSADDIDRKFWYILNLALVCTTILAVETYRTTGSSAMMIAQGLNLLLGITVMIQVVYYQEKNKNKLI